MTRKHFNAIAAILAASRLPADQLVDTQWKATRDALALMCAGENPNFDRHRFIAATEK